VYGLCAAEPFVYQERPVGREQRRERVRRRVFGSRHLRRWERRESIPCGGIIPIVRIEWLATIDTTQRRARELVEQGDRRYDAVCADHQTAGRGRQGAQWLDAPGQSLLVSLILWDAPLPEPVGLLGVCAALATADALEAHYPDLPPLRLKYPNDLLLHGRKLGGVLAEVVEGVAVVGIGVNLAQGVFPPELAATAISVGQAGGRGVGERVSESKRAALIAAIAGNLRGLLTLWRDAPAQVYARWQARDDTAGRAYRIQDLPDQPVGVALGVRPDFQLALRLPSGETYNTYYASTV
jgi:BirA family biotin operon repressor/biotin-[acetyl-CoA-carboxylase] ligase